MFASYTCLGVAHDRRIETLHLGDVRRMQQDDAAENHEANVAGRGVKHLLVMRPGLSAMHLIWEYVVEYVDSTHVLPPLLRRELMTVNG